MSLERPLNLCTNGAVHMGDVGIGAFSQGLGTKPAGLDTDYGPRGRAGAGSRTACSQPLGQVHIDPRAEWERG